MIKSVFVSTTNAHKLKEIETLLMPHGLSVASLVSLVSPLPTIVEDGDTFTENALKKLAPFSPHPTGVLLADDSGLVVDALNGEPGIYSARYAGEAATDVQNLALVLSLLKGESDRRARFVCVIAIKFPDGTLRTVEGCVEGTIASESVGDKGFGYDPIFVPDGYDLPFSVLGDAIKNTVSHRRRALDKAVACILEAV